MSHTVSAGEDGPGVPREPGELGRGSAVQQHVVGLRHRQDIMHEASCTMNIYITLTLDTYIHFYYGSSTNMQLWFRRLLDHNKADRFNKGAHCL